MERLLVVGNGMAGARTVEEILERGGGERFEITMFGDEPHGNYNRISLSNVLAGAEDPRDIFLNPLDWYEENGIRLHAGRRIVRLDSHARRVYTEDGLGHEYDVLIIATGSRSHIPPIHGLYDAKGALKAGVFGFRNMKDCDRMLAWAEEAGRAAVIGGGLLGLEAARGLVGRGLDVEVVHRPARLMNLQLDEHGADILRHAV
jgi:nitrite reductase (NADH) large subunit